MNDLENAKKMLLSGNYTCVLSLGDVVYTSVLRGVKPLVQYNVSSTSFEGFSAADKVVGRATAFLYLLLGVTRIYAKVISQSALELLLKNGIEVEYESLVENIINREGTGICPFEAAVLDIDESQAAYRLIIKKMDEMGIKLL